MFFLQKAYGYAQLLPPVLEQLKVLKVSSEADVSEDRLFELDARLYEVSIHVECRDLARKVFVLGLEPIHILFVLLHHFY